MLNFPGIVHNPTDALLRHGLENPLFPVFTYHCFTRYYRQAITNYEMVTFRASRSKGRHQNSLLLTINFSHNFTQPSEGISYPVGDLCRCFTKWTLPIVYTLHSDPIPVQLYYKQVTSVSPACFYHPTVGNCDVSPNEITDL